VKILVAYDGSFQSKNALRYGIEKAEEKGGEVISLHVFNSNMFIDYDAGPGAVETARREFYRHVKDAERLIGEIGGQIQVNSVVAEGNPEEAILRYAKSENVGLVLATPAYKSIARTAPCPVCIIPGNIIVALDNTDSWLTCLDQTIKEAKITGSQVLLLGIVPVHLYSRSEKKEVEKIKKETAMSIKRMKEILNKEDIRTKDIMRSGYPDEELLEVAARYPQAMIIVPSGKAAESELNKAVNVILNEPWRFKMPIQLMPAPR